MYKRQTFDRELRTGQFPLQHWDPVRAAAVAADIKDFLHGQHYANKTSFDALQPYLNQVVQNSERLTVMIFCDGLNETKWTPYDKAINEIFKLRQAERIVAMQLHIVPVSYTHLLFAVNFTNTAFVITSPTELVSVKGVSNASLVT